MKEITKKLLKKFVYEEDEEINSKMSFEEMLEQYEQWKESEENDFGKFLKNKWII